MPPQNTFSKNFYDSNNNKKKVKNPDNRVIMKTYRKVIYHLCTKILEKSLGFFYIHSKILHSTHKL